MSKNDVVLLVAGGTGGHVFPAIALSHELKKRGYTVCLATDSRAKHFSQKNFAGTIYEISSSKINLSNFANFFCSMAISWKGLIGSFFLIIKLKPKVIIGFGGYPTVFPLLIAIILRIPSIIHEQNVIMGRANRLLSLGVKVIAGGLFSKKKGFLSHKIIETGNPIRSSLMKMANIPYKSSGPNEPFRLLVFGGSQGAKIFSEVIPRSIALIPAKQRERLIITQQVREEEQEEVKKQYDHLGLTVHIASFFYDIDEHVAKANLLICRSGALTISEIAVMGRPAILIPYPYSVNNDQLLNAQFLQEGGGAEVITQDFLSPEKLAKSISYAMNHPDYLARMANNVSKKGKTDSVLLLSNIVDQILLK
ncbi:MAG: undecaprenyldiphospho-muramoylpentapeptide beta-N-acetylglucosaminyltransferase [Candidatus Liberibacter europaeus]|uniref:UDP-N-acetylglucosamine--N-acetylmuramyl-(pentapeptide) pyrophosphoryl-undecaprenol N-acetylglucosamine transferase n=1 Tax=Candidatus Liberibacter europaeus TaxID=744859 RepID=A0A2T4VWJ7_9HYPH|nr:undecaprenyldiphospho-muramoylpentapeptide beta-N-acetylglucosaminyltransferase [Candidatus Liberibacter europaeus]PTL86158.1 MAG: undecaprenyldiphospho-muramoylpentapeptide beta-N-acetylglucosaminyltransferase [Candidatus Liberibacter europaeus]